MLRWLPLLLACAAGALPAGAAASVRAVVVPFENVTRRAPARDVVMPAVEAALAAKGYEVVSGAPVEEFLQARRIRFLDSLGAAHVRELTSLHGADAVVVGSILAYDPGAPDPLVTIAVRLVSTDGAIAWTNLASLSLSTTGGAFDRGKLTRIDDLARRVVADALGPLPLAGKLAPVPPEPETFPEAPRVFRSRDLMGQRLEICVLPLQNLTRNRDAPRIIDAVLQHRLSARPDTTAIQPGDLRAAIVKGKLRAPAALSLEQLGELAKVVGTPLFLRGAILAYGGPDVSGGAAAVELYLTLIDARSGRIVWSGLHRRAGSDYEGLLRFGAVHDDALLASRVVAELLDAFTRRVSAMEAE